jgi:hypothetical protein
MSNSKESRVIPDSDSSYWIAISPNGTKIGGFKSEADAASFLEEYGDQVDSLIAFGQPFMLSGGKVIAGRSAMIEQLEEAGAISPTEAVELREALKEDAAH